MTNKYDPFAPMGPHVDALYNIRRAMRRLRLAEQRLVKYINREKRNAKSTNAQKRQRGLAQLRNDPKGGHPTI